MRIGGFFLLGCFNICRTQQLGQIIVILIVVKFKCVEIIVIHLNNIAHIR